MKKHNIKIPYDEEVKCSACGSVGINMLDEEDVLYGDSVLYTQKVLVCECGHIVRVYDGDETGEEE